MTAIWDELRRFAASVPLYLRLWPYVRTERRWLLMTLAAMLGGTLVTLGRPWPAQVAVDSILGDAPLPAWFATLAAPFDPVGQLMVAGLLLAGFALVGNALTVGEDYASLLLGQRMVYRLRCDLFARLQALSIRFHDQHGSADLVYRVTTDAAALQNVVAYGLLPLIVHLVTILAVAIAVFLLHPYLGLIAICAVPAVMFWAAWFSERVKGRARRHVAADSALYAGTGETLASVRATKAFTREADEIERFTARAAGSRDEYVAVTLLNTLGGVAARAIAGVAAAVALLVGALLVLDGALALGELLVFAMYLQALHGPTMLAASAALTIQRSGASVERLLQLLDERDEDAREPGAEPPAVEGSVRFEHVAFAYDPDMPVLQDVDFAIEPGELVAVVGRSGVGKTTLVGLLLRFFRPSRGRILLDDLDISTLDARWLRRQIGLVLQDSAVFSTTIEENIAYGRAGASRDEILEASRAAGLHDFIARLPEGYRTMVGERGVRLSAGQRQRIGIARAFLKNAPVLVMDEPTANLDATSELEMIETIRRVGRERVTLVIAHRLSLARRADRIVVLEAGKVVECGPHLELLALDGIYASLYRDQGEDIDHTSASSLVSGSFRARGST